MNRKIILSVIISTLIISTVLGLLIGLKIDYYERVSFDIRDSNVFVVLDNEPKTVFINIYNIVYEVHGWVPVVDKTYLLDFTINKDINDKVFCYISTYKLNYLSYIFKIVFNI